MMKVFVVDDEVRQRKSIIRHVDWKRFEMEVAGEAEDAGQAIALAETEVPDLLITDIRLMGMSGLELSARMRALNPELRIIMVTGYEEFEYAKTALDLGVDAFLVKPIDFGQLAAVLEQMNREKQMNRKKQDEEAQVRDQLVAFSLIARDNMLQELIHGLVFDETDILARARSLGMFAAEIPRSIIVVALDHLPHLSGVKEEALQHAQAMIRMRAEEVCGSCLEGVTTTPRGDIVLIISDRAEMQAEALLQAFETTLGDTYTVSIGVGKTVVALTGLCESFQLALRAVNLRLLGRSAHIYNWNEIVENPELTYISVDEMTDLFFERMGAGDSQGSRGTLGDLMRRLIGDVSIHGAEMRSMCLDLVSRASRVAGEIGGADKHLGSEKALWKELLACGEDMELLQATIRILTGFSDYIADKKMSHAQVIVRKALEFMNGHYKENLTLSTVADAVFLSPNYLGALLRAELGQSFTDLLMHIRIGKAKELLQNSGMKLYEVAESVGYQNIGYFTGLFKRMTGLSPKAYRNFIGAADEE